MNHPYSGAASYIYASEHDRDDVSETGIYAHIKSLIPDAYEGHPPTPIQSPSATQTNLAYSLASSMKGSPLSSPKSKRLSFQSRKRVLRSWDGVPDILPPSSIDRNDGNRLNNMDNRSAWTRSRGRVHFESVRTPQTMLDINPQASFVDFRETEQRILQLERGDALQRARSEGWGRRFRRHIQEAFHMLRRLWT